MCKTEKQLFLCLQYSLFVIFKTEEVSLKQAAEDVENNFNYESKVVGNDKMKKK